MQASSGETRPPDVVRLVAIASPLRRVSDERTQRDCQRCRAEESSRPILSGFVAGSRKDFRDLVPGRQQRHSEKRTRGSTVDAKLCRCEALVLLDVRA